MVGRVNFILLACTLLILIIYPIVIYFVIKYAYVKMILGDLIDNSIKKLEKSSQNVINELYDKVLEDVEEMRVKSMSDLKTIADYNVDKFVKLAQSAEINLEFS